MREASSLKPAQRQVRRRGKDQLAALIQNIERFGVVLPILVNANGEIVDGHGVWEAAKALGLDRIPTVQVSHLKPAEERALRLSLGRLPQMSVWDEDALKLEFEYLFEIDPQLIGFTAFEMPEVDRILGRSATEAAEPDLPPVPIVPVTRLGDRWCFPGGHVAGCFDAKDPASYARLLGGRQAQMVLVDPPFALVEIRGVVSRKHENFVEGAGLDEAQAGAFFGQFLAAMLPHVQDGAIVDLFIDYRAMFVLTGAVREAGLNHLCTAVWAKSPPGMGGLYRHACEFVLVTKWGKAAHINNVKLGKFGRNRSTLWAAPGMAGFGAGRKAALDAHPTPKPVALLSEAILDTSLVGGIILDPFLGSGSLLLAAHRTKRIGIGGDLDPRYVDVAVKRMQTFTGEAAVHADTGLTFEAMAKLRQEEACHEDA